ncbi:porin [Marinobacter sp.]|uniref:porin n=1 Tax=Marinobacter sp. TaxID=50741 RepID=UPI0035699031
MKKTLIASAIAAATFSGSVLAQESNLPTIYGNIQLAATYDDYKDGPSETNHFDNGSTVGVLHDHAITPNLEGFFKAEFHFDAEANDANADKDDGIYEIDEAYIGVRGDNFGQLWVGKDDSTYERAVTVISEYYETAVIRQAAPYSTGEGDLVQYMSPSFGGLSIWGAVQYNGDSDTKGGDDKSFPWQLAAVYTMDNLELAAAIDSNDNTGLDANNENTYGVRGTYSLDNLALTAEYHTRDDVRDTYGVMGVYTLGANRFALSYERTEEDFGSELDYDTVTLQALHNLSDNMYVYVEGYLGGGDNVYEYEDDAGNDAYTDERTVAAVGAVYYF